MHAYHTGEEIALKLVRARTRSALLVIAMLHMKPKLTAKDLKLLRRARQEARLARQLGI